MPTDEAPPTECWQFETGGDIRSSPTVYDDSVYVGSNDGALYAVNRHTGEQRWAFQTDGPVRSSPTVFGGTVYVGSDDGTVYAINRETGTPRWQYQTDGSIVGGPVIFNLTLYVGTTTGRVYALDLHTEAPMWTVETDGEIVSSPLVVEDTVFVGSTDGMLTAIVAASGDIRWSFETTKEIRTPPTVSENAIYVGDRSGTIYALTHADGNEIGRLEGDAPTSGLGEWTALSPPTAVGGTLVFGNYMGRTYAARVQSEVQGTLWKHEGMLGIQSAPAIANDRVYVGDLNMIHALDLGSGEQEWQLKLDEADHFRSSPTVTDGTLYIGNDNGTLYAISIDESRASRDSRTEFGTLGHHERHALFQSTVGLYRCIGSGDDEVLEEVKRLNKKMDAALWTDES